jgi:DNA-binding MarR family transcriptional regulator
VERAIERTAALHGMSGREMIVLGTLRRKGPPYESTPTGLKQLLWLSLPGLKKRLDRLEALGMVTRVSNPRDRRGQMVRLTPRGHAALDDLVAHPQAVVYRTLLKMPKAQLAQLSGLLRDLLAQLESQDGAAHGR